MRAVGLPDRALTELASSEWTVVLANIALTGLSGPLFDTLRELARAQVLEDDPKKRRVRVMFLVPEILGFEVKPVLERDQLPYVLKPLNLNDFLEKVSDLMMEAHAIPEPIRKVKTFAKDRRARDRRVGYDRRRGEMFSSREDHSMGEEEYAEYEKQMQEQEKEQERKREQERKSLGQPEKN